jgi:hypothetical protein
MLLLTKYIAIRNVLSSVIGATNHIPVFPNIKGNKYMFIIRSTSPFKLEIIDNLRKYLI